MLMSVSQLLITFTPPDNVVGSLVFIPLPVAVLTPPVVLRGFSGILTTIERKTDLESSINI